MAWILGSLLYLGFVLPQAFFSADIFQRCLWFAVQLSDPASCIIFRQPGLTQIVQATLKTRQIVMVPSDLVECCTGTNSEELLDFRARFLYPPQFHQNRRSRQQGIGIGRVMQLERAPRLIKATKDAEGASPQPMIPRGIGRVALERQLYLLQAALWIVGKGMQRA